MRFCCSAASSMMTKDIVLVKRNIAIFMVGYNGFEEMG
jgi:hypothetical protein